MAGPHSLAMTAAVLASLLQILASQSRHYDVITKYFSAHSFICNNSDINVPTNPEVDKLYWILPDGSLVTEQSEIEKENLILTGSQTLAYNLTLTRINDDDFGYYTCIISRHPTNSVPDRLSLMRWGLNLGGADHSEIQETYRQSAILGAIAAAVLLALVGLSCMIYHFRFSLSRTLVGDCDLDQLAYDNPADVSLVMDDIHPNFKNSPPAFHKSGHSEDDVHNGVVNNSYDEKL